jgi:hypothetical protein
MEIVEYHCWYMLIKYNKKYYYIIKIETETKTKR